jgi:hypothetical protein
MNRYAQVLTASALAYTAQASAAAKWARGTTMSSPPQFIATAEQLVALTKQPRARHLVVCGDLANVPSFRLAPGQTLTGNGLGEWIDQPQLNEPPLAIDGAAAHWDHRVDEDHYQQPGALFRLMNAAQRQALFDNTARQIGAAAKHIQEPHIANCTKADPAYGAGVAQAIARLV